MENRMWKFIILYSILSGPLRVKATENVIGGFKAHEIVHSVDKKRQELIPYPRMGRSNLKTYQGLSALELLQKELAEKAKESQRLMATHDEAKGDKFDDTEYDGSEYLLPYPRPGRELDIQNSDASLTEQEIMLPHLRFGKSFEFKNGNARHYGGDMKRNDASSNNVDYDTSGQFMTPYPRIGKRNEDLMTPYPRFGRSDEYLTPYPRIGKSDEFMTPYPRIGRSDEFLTPYPRLGRNVEYITPYPRLGKRSSDDILLPYPRMGRSFGDKASDDQADYLIPYPRPGKRTLEESIMIPYPRLGKRTSEETILPYPRMDRRQTSVNSVLYEDNDQDLPYMIPYLRPGKRSDSGRDNLKFKNQQMNSLANRLLHIRMGRSGNDKKQNDTDSDRVQYEEEEEGDTITMIPNFRFGRSLSKNIHTRKKRSTDTTVESQILLPNLRFGKNAELFASSSPGFEGIESNSFKADGYFMPHKGLNQAKYLRLRKDSEREKLIKNKAHKLVSAKQDFDQDSNLNEYYMLPYPRPGRRSI